MADSFYKQGLKFTCTACGACCSGAPGHVFLTQKDIDSLLAHLKMEFALFVKTYCKLVETDAGITLSLQERSNYDCVFLSAGACAVYAARPVQCRTFPFWSSVLSSAESWKSYAEDCPGMNHGRHFSEAEIQDEILARRSEQVAVFPKDYFTDGVKS